MNPADARALDQIAPRRARWHRRALAIAVLAAVAVAASVTWLKVVHTVQHPDPVKITRQPRVSALVWSGRVFVDASTFKRWLEASDTSYAEWARRHPRALWILERARTRR